ncbi:hypothetical protein HDU76_003568 [Blyttiomyces sp. JEL0837]|nr:hypothetical protein HDU76_003568 [Blyttiomyces sp. JEL0837]
MPTITKNFEHAKKELFHPCERTIFADRVRERQFKEFYGFIDDPEPVVCSDCKGKGRWDLEENFIESPETGDLVCGNCGLVVMIKVSDVDEIIRERWNELEFPEVQSDPNQTPTQPVEEPDTPTTTFSEEETIQPHLQAALTTTATLTTPTPTTPGEAPTTTVSVEEPIQTYLQANSTTPTPTTPTFDIDVSTISDSSSEYQMNLVEPALFNDIDIPNEWGSDNIPPALTTPAVGAPQPNGETTDLINDLNFNSSQQQIKLNLAGPALFNDIGIPDESGSIDNTLTTPAIVTPQPTAQTAQMTTDLINDLNFGFSQHQISEMFEIAHQSIDSHPPLPPLPARRTTCGFQPCTPGFCPPSQVQRSRVSRLLRLGGMAVICILEKLDIDETLLFDVRNTAFGILKMVYQHDQELFKDEMLSGTAVIALLIAFKNEHVYCDLESILEASTSVLSRREIRKVYRKVKEIVRGNMGIARDNRFNSIIQMDSGVDISRSNEAAVGATGSPSRKRKRVEDDGDGLHEDEDWSNGTVVDVSLEVQVPSYGVVPGTKSQSQKRRRHEESGIFGSMEKVVVGFGDLNSQKTSTSATKSLATNPNEVTSSRNPINWPCLKRQRGEGADLDQDERPTKKGKEKQIKKR